MIFRNTNLPKNQHPSGMTHRNSGVYIVSIVDKSFHYFKETDGHYSIESCNYSFHKDIMDINQKTFLIDLKQYYDSPYVNPNDYQGNLSVLKQFSNITNARKFIQSRGLVTGSKYHKEKHTKNVSIYAWASYPTMGFMIYFIEYLKYLPKKWLIQQDHSNKKISYRFNIKPKQLSKESILDYSPSQLIKFMDWDLSPNWTTS